jgi:hypothetical protein
MRCKSDLVPLGRTRCKADIAPLDRNISAICRIKNAIINRIIYIIDRIKNALIIDKALYFFTSPHKVKRRIRGKAGTIINAIKNKLALPISGCWRTEAVNKAITNIPIPKDAYFFLTTSGFS